MGGSTGTSTQYRCHYKCRLLTRLGKRPRRFPGKGLVRGREQMSSGAGKATKKGNSYAVLEFRMQTKERVLRKDQTRLIRVPVRVPV